MVDLNIYNKRIMGCHTWIFRHIPEKQEMYKKKILEAQKNDSQWLYNFYTNNDNKMALYDDYIDFINDCNEFLCYVNTVSKETLINEYGSYEFVEKEKEWAEKAAKFPFDDFINYHIDVCKEKLTNINNGIIEESGTFFDADTNKHLMYKIVDGKIYINGDFPHGDDIGRINDYNQPYCWSADETIECFKKHNSEFDEDLIKEIFKQNDMFINFG